MLEHVPAPRRPFALNMYCHWALHVDLHGKVDRALHDMGLRVLKTPAVAPQANAYCERLIGTARCECLDWVIPLDERQLRRVLGE